jgi:hypothetical protein
MKLRLLATLMFPLALALFAIFGISNLTENFEHDFEAVDGKTVKEMIITYGPPSDDLGILYERVHGVRVQIRDFDSVMIWARNDKVLLANVVDDRIESYTVYVTAREPRLWDSILATFHLAVRKP